MKKLICIAGALACGAALLLTGCGEEPKKGPAESVGAAVDKTAKDASKTADKAVVDTKKVAEDTKKDASKAAEAAKPAQK